MGYSSGDFNELFNLTSPKIKIIFLPIFNYLIELSNCDSMIKDDYAVFSIVDGIVTAIFPTQDYIDVLLALPLDKSDKMMFDAVDMGYKWRNLPCGIRVETAVKAKAALSRVKMAQKLVASGTIQEQDGTVFARPKAAFQPAFKKKLRFR